MRRYGWFEYHDAPWRIINFKSGQQVTFESSEPLPLPEHIHNPAPDTRSIFIQDLFPRALYDNPATTFHFIYEDHEVKQPVQFMVFQEKGKTRKLIHLKYNNIFTTPPTYGLWRRIDDFLTDALLSHPSRIFEHHYIQLITSGAWYQGKWEATVVRQFQVDSINTSEEAFIAEPCIHPLDYPIPSQWSYVDFEHPQSDVELRFTTDKTFDVPYIPINSPLTGFEDRTAYLHRNDLKAFIFLASAEHASGRDNDIHSTLWYTYADEEQFFTFRSSENYSSLELGTVKNYGFRLLPPERYMLSVGLNGRPFGENGPPYSSTSGNVTIPYYTWRKTLHALMDAWPKWSKDGFYGQRPTIFTKAARSENRSLNSQKTFIGNWGPNISHGYVAGIKDSNFKLRYETPESRESYSK